jgi:hydrogenase maturation protein HypF
MGRWFDAAAGLLGVSTRQSYEGQAPMLLEGLAAGHGAVPPDRYAVDGGVLDLLPLLAALADETDAARGAARFHATLVAALADWCISAARTQQLSRIAFGGGCFNNRLLASGLAAQLSAAGLAVLQPRQAPPNDGGIALGQAAVARALLAAH